MDIKSQIKLKILRNFDEAEYIPCIYCSDPCYIRYDRRYNGLRGSCPSCNSEWAES